jgi:hypothetical protein
MSTDLKPKLLAVLLALSLGLLIGLCVGGFLVAKVPGGLLYAVASTCGLFVTTLFHGIKQLEDHRHEHRK